jgi:class III poly(R)-hydroxyalkanoic acid synthase PhaC subunit
MQLFSDYESSYTNSVLKSLDLPYANDKDDNNKVKTNLANSTINNSNKSTPFIDPLSYYDNLLAISNNEFRKRLRSKDSLKHFKDHVDAIVNLESSIRQVSPSFSLFPLIDWYVDTSHLPFHNAVVSINETPHEVVRQVDATRLLRYHSASAPAPSQNTTSSLPASPIEQNSVTAAPAAISPLLMIYAPINRYHILDLSPERSVVQKFVSAGFDVFLLDWGEKQSDNKPMLSDYVDYVGQAVEQIRKITKHEKINLYGYSWGGTLSIMYAAIHSSKIKNLVLQSANYDFDKDDTVIAEWMRNFPVEGFIDEFKEVFGHFIDLAFLMRNPIAHSFDTIRYAFETKEEDSIKFLENLAKIRSWVNNTPDIPGPMFRQFAIDLYRQNLLAKNQLILDKQAGNEVVTEANHTKKAVDLKNITMPILNIVGNKDDLVSLGSSTPITEGYDGDGRGIIPSEDKSVIEFPSDHIELCISHDAHKNLWPQVTQWLKERS